jgi:hypothetical protein
VWPNLPATQPSHRWLVDRRSREGPSDDRLHLAPFARRRGVAVNALPAVNPSDTYEKDYCAAINPSAAGGPDMLLYTSL